MEYVDSLVAADLVAALPKLRRYARVLVGGRDGADRLVVETLADAWRSKQARPPGVQLLPWLFGLMHAMYRRDLRQADPPRQAAAPSADKEQPAGGSAGSRVSGDGAQDMCTQLLRLPVDEREVLLLVTVEHLSYADIANVLDVPVATVMSALVRARARLCAMRPPASDGT